MISKEFSHTSGVKLAKYISTPKKGETVELFENFGSIHDKLTKKSFQDAGKRMDQKKTSKATYPCGHIIISPGKEESKKMSKDDIRYCVDTTMKWRNLTGRQRMVAIHKDFEGMHFHVGYSKFNPATGKMDRNSLFAEDLYQARRETEQHFGWKPTPKKNKDKPRIKQELSDLYATRSNNPRQFVKAVEDLGYRLSYGGAKRPFQVTDEKNVSHPLARMIEVSDKKNVTEKALREYLSGVQLESLDVAREYQKTHAEEISKKRQKQQFDYSPDSRPEPKKDSPLVELLKKTMTRKHGPTI